MFIVGEQYAFHMLEPHPEQGWGHSCLTTIGTLAGRNVITIEGLSKSGQHPLQRAWSKYRNAVIASRGRL